MASRKKLSNSIVKKQASERLTGKKSQSGQLRIKGYEIQDLEFLRVLQGTYQNILLSISACMCTVVLLVQLRCLRPDTPSSKMDQLPSYKFYKKRVLTDDSGIVTSFTLAICLPDPILYFPENPTDLERYLISMLDCYQGNERFIEKCSSENVSDFIYGHMSRIMGIITSCCSANISAFGLASDCSTWTVSETLAHIPFEDISNLDSDLVKQRIRSSCLVANGEDGFSPIVFQEAPFTGSNSVKGGCIMEHDIFGEHMPQRVISSKDNNSTGTSVKTTITDEQFKDVLSPIEYRKLQSARSLGRNDLIKKYVDIASKLLKQQPEDDAPSASAKIKGKSPSV